MGSSNLRVVQFGKESTYGAAVAAAAIMSGVSDFKFDPGIVNTGRRYLAGSFAETQKMVQTRKMPSVEISGDLTPEDFLYVADSAIKGSVSPTGTNPYTWVFPFQNTTAGAVRSRTLELYDGNQEYEMTGALVSKFSIAGADSDSGIVTFNSTWEGADFVKDAITSSLSARAYNVFPTGLCQLYIDSAGGTIGSTAKSNTLISWSVDVETGLHRKYFQTASLASASFGYDVPKISMKLTVEFNSTTITELDNFLAGTSKLWRISGTSGSTNFYWDMGGYASNVSAWEVRDGNTTATFTVSPIYDTGAFANYAKLTFVNAVSTLVSNA